VLGDLPHALAGGDLQDRGRPLAQVGRGGMVPGVGQFGALRRGQVETKASGHGQHLPHILTTSVRIIIANRINPGYTSGRERA
jgi:hypothetical protein